jgi:hypothetical protein
LRRDGITLVVVASDPLFDSAWFKWAQAIVHANALQAEIKASAERGYSDPLFSARTQYEAHRHGFAVIVEKVAPVPMRWRLLLGDIANDYRAALDHLAWALVSRGRTPPGTLTPKQENAVYFLICETKSMFDSQVRDPPKPDSLLKMPGLRRADRAKVRRYQPYRYSRARSMHVFTLLTKINNGDKHRTVQPLLPTPTRVDLEVTDARDCAPPTIPRQGFPRRAAVLEPDAELAFIRTRRTGPNPQLDVKVKLIAEPCVHERVGIGEWVGRCGAYIASLLSELSDPPKGIAEIEPKAGMP